MTLKKVCPRRQHCIMTEPKVCSTSPSRIPPPIPPRRKSQKFSGKELRNEGVDQKRCMSMMISQKQNPDEQVELQKQLTELRYQKTSLTNRNGILLRKNNVLTESIASLQESFTTEESHTKTLLQRKTELQNEFDTSKKILDELLSNQGTARENLTDEITTTLGLLEREFRLMSAIKKENGILDQNLKDIKKALEQETTFVNAQQQNLKEDLELIHTTTIKLSRPILNSEADSTFSIPSFESDTEEDDISYENSEDDTASPNISAF